MTGLAPEFQQKQAIQARQFQAQNNPQNGPKEHPEDTLIVRNILVNDNTEIEEVIPYAVAKQSIDPSSGQQHFVNQIQTNTFEHSWNTKDYFEVRWDGRPHRINAGETRRMPRYLAEHFAKYLIDFILIQREAREKVTGLLKNRIERKRLYDQIIVGVDSYYNGDMWNYEREGNYVEEQVGKLNAPDTSVNLGAVPNAAAGYALSDEAPKPVVEVPPAPTTPDPLLPLPPFDPPAPTPIVPTALTPDAQIIPPAPTTNPILAGSPAPTTAPLVPPTREEIIKSKSKDALSIEAEALGIILTGKENKDQIYDLIASF